MRAERPRVILNDRPLRRAWTGVAHYITQLLAALPEVDPELDLLPFYQTYIGRRGATAHQPPGGPPAGRTQGRWPGWLRHAAQGAYDVALETVGLTRGYRVYHEPNHIPASWPGPIVTTVHDLSVLRYPEWHPADRVRWYERDFLPALPRTQHFITVSEFTKREMVEMLGIAPERITAIHLGARAIFHPRPAEQVRAWLRQHHLPEDYLLYVGTIEPRKNVNGLLAAYAGLPPRVRQRTRLLLAGTGGWAGHGTEASLRRRDLSGQARMLGYVNDEALAYLYAGARALVWPTFYEGFGLPPLECMVSGTPVISSSASAVPEVVGDAGLLVDPHDIRAVNQAILRVLEDEPYAASLSRKGLERGRAFSWSRCAAEHARIYRRLGEGDE